MIARAWSMRIAARSPRRKACSSRCRSPGIGSRFMALLIDLADRRRRGADRDPRRAGGSAATSRPTIVGRLRVLVVYVGYHVVFEVFGGGRTLGKRAAGLRVVTDGGAPVGLRASLIRNVIRLLEGSRSFYVPAIDLGARDQEQPAPRRPRRGHAGGPRPARRERRSRRRRRSMAPQRYASWDVTGIGEEEASAVRAFLERRAELRPGARARARGAARRTAAPAGGRRAPRPATTRPSSSTSRPRKRGGR